MKKGTVIFIVAVVFILIGVFSVTISWNNFFFTTKFYQDPMAAYNAAALYDPIQGNIKATKSIGVFEIDEENALFLGEISNDAFLVAQMKTKNKEYAFEGTVVIYRCSDSFKKEGVNLTDAKTGTVKWVILNDGEELEALPNPKAVKEYSMPNGSPLYLVVFE